MFLFFVFDKAMLALITFIAAAFCMMDEIKYLIYRLIYLLTNLMINHLGNHPYTFILCLQFQMCNHC